MVRVFANDRSLQNNSRGRVPLGDDVDGSPVRGRDGSRLGTLVEVRPGDGSSPSGWGVVRSTFVIDEDGNIDQALYNVKATGHVARVRTLVGL